MKRKPAPAAVVRWHFVVSAELDSAARKKLGSRELSALVRELVADWLARPALAGVQGVGRPRKEGEQ